MDSEINFEATVKIPIGDFKKYVGLETRVEVLKAYIKHEPYSVNKKIVMDIVSGVWEEGDEE